MTDFGKCQTVKVSKDQEGDWATNRLEGRRYAERQSGRQRAGVCASLVYEWVEKKLLPHFRLGKGGTRGKIAIAEEELDALLQENRVGPGQPKAAPAPKPKRIMLENL